MALETLKGLIQIGDHKVHEVNWNHPTSNFIEINHQCNAITFKIQNGPIKEMGVNGCQVTDMIVVAQHIIEGLDKYYPCRENAMTITKLDEALMWQIKRTKDREDRGVEGLNKE